MLGGRWALAPAAAVLALPWLTACDDTVDNSAPVLSPGAPGESASPATEEELEAAGSDAEPNEADIEFLLMMIVHHEQAVEMSELAPDSAENSDIETIAERISVAQGVEIQGMEEWLETNVFGPARDNPRHQNYCGLEQQADEEAHHGADCEIVEHDDMPGLATDTELSELEEAEDTDFDELFVDLMVAHHEGGIDMAEDVLIDGHHTQIQGMANDMMAEQSTEITLMQNMRG